MTQNKKVICAVAAPITATIPDIPGLRGYAVHQPYPGEAPEQPDHVGGVAMVWMDVDAPVEPASWFAGHAVDAYVVDEHVRFEYERTWPDGTTSPGPRRISFIRRASGISRADMARHWGDVHSKLVPVHHPGVWRYVQNVVVAPATPDAPEVDGIAELHFRTVDDLRNRFYDSDEGRRIVAEDVRHFLDPPHGWRMLAEETWLRTPGI